MQESTIEEFDAPREETSRIAGIRGVASTVLGAVVAVALLLTMGVWFYRLGVRDAQNVPIIRAALEPVKVRPEDPGGTETPHQEITSYEVAESEPVQAAAAVIAPAPPEPRPEDVAMGDLEEQQAAVEDFQATPTSTQTPTTTSSEALQAEIDRQVVAVLAEQTSPKVAAPAQDEDVSQSAAAESVAQAIEPVATQEPEVVEEEPTEQELKPVLGGTEFAPGASPAAPRRPNNLLARVEVAKQEEERSVTDLASRAANSSVQVQLAADPSESAIRQQWSRIYSANSDILRDRALAVQSTVSGGTTFYRLRVGPFRSASEARAVCQALKARGQDCIVARNS